MNEGREPVGPTQGFRNLRHLAHQATLLLSSGVVGYVGAFGLNVLLARRLGAAAFGAWAVAVLFGGTLATLGLVGADWIVIRQGSYYEGVGDLPRLRRTMHLALRLSGTALALFGVGLFAAASFIGHHFFRSASMVTMLRIAAVVGPVQGVGQLMLYGTQAFKSLRDLALIRNLLQPLARLLLAGGAAIAFGTPVAAFAGVLVAEALLAVAAVVAFNRRLPLFGSTEGVESASLVRFAMPIWGIRLMETSRAMLFPVLLGAIASLSSSAAFVAAGRITALPSAVIVALNQIYNPMASSLYLQERRSELSELFKSVGKWSFALGWPLFGVMAAFPKELLTAFGGSFRSASAALVVLAFSALFNFGTGPVTVTLILSGRSGLALIDYVVTLFAEIAIGAWLIPSQGILGAAYGRMVGSALNSLLPMAQIWWLQRMHPYRIDYWKPFAAGLVSVGLAKLVVAGSGLGTGLPAAAGACVLVGLLYVVLLTVLRPSEQDRAGLDALMRAARLRRGASAAPTAAAAPPPVDATERPVGD